MSSGVFDVSVWIEPFGLFSDERRGDDVLWEGGDLPLAVAAYAVVLALDVLTLPLAPLYYAGVGRADDA